MKHDKFCIVRNEIKLSSLNPIPTLGGEAEFSPTFRISRGKKGDRTLFLVSIFCLRNKLSVLEMLFRGLDQIPLNCHFKVSRNYSNVNYIFFLYHWEDKSALKPNFHTSEKFQTIGDFVVSRPFQTFLTNEIVDIPSSLPIF